jgi:hypothetical protein
MEVESPCSKNSKWTRRIHRTWSFAYGSDAHGSPMSQAGVRRSCRISLVSVVSVCASVPSMIGALVASIRRGTSSKGTFTPWCSPANRLEIHCVVVCPRNEICPGGVAHRIGSRSCPTWSSKPNRDTPVNRSRSNHHLFVVRSSLGNLKSKSVNANSIRRSASRKSRKLFMIKVGDPPPTNRNMPEDGLL